MINTYCCTCLSITWYNTNNLINITINTSSSCLSRRITIKTSYLVISLYSKRINMSNRAQIQSIYGRRIDTPLWICESVFEMRSFTCFCTSNKWNRVDINNFRSLCRATTLGIIRTTCLCSRIPYFSCWTTCSICPYTTTDSTNGTMILLITTISTGTSFVSITDSISVTNYVGTSFKISRYFCRRTTLRCFC